MAWNQTPGPRLGFTCSIVGPRASRPAGYRHHCAGKTGPAPNRFVVTFAISFDTGVGGLAAQQASPPGDSFTASRFFHSDGDHQAVTPWAVHLLAFPGPDPHAVCGHDIFLNVRPHTMQA